MSEHTGICPSCQRELPLTLHDGHYVLDQHTPLFAGRFPAEGALPCSGYHRPPTRVIKQPRMHVCIRIYANGDRKREDRTPEDMPAWVAYNAAYRPGNALFVDGVCKGTGYFTAEQCAQIEESLR